MLYIESRRLGRKTALGFLMLAFVIGAQVLVGGWGLYQMHREMSSQLVSLSDFQVESLRLKVGLNEMRKLEKDKQLNASQRAARAREIAKKETEKLFGKTDVVHAPQRTFKPLDSVKLGQEVLIAELDKPGIVTALPDRDGMVEVRAGIIKTKVPLNGLCAPHKQQPAPQKKYQPRRAPAGAQFRHLFFQGGLE